MLLEKRFSGAGALSGRASGFKLTEFIFRINHSCLVWGFFQPLSPPPHSCPATYRDRVIRIRNHGGNRVVIFRVDRC